MFHVMGKNNKRTRAENQNYSLLIKRQIENTTPVALGLDRRGLVPCYFMM